MIIVHHLNNSRSQRILWLLEELGLEYQIKPYTRDPETQLAPPALREVHPLGKSPVISDGEIVVAESGAIIEYLVGSYGPQLKPESGSEPGRQFTYWLHFAEGSLMPPLLLKLVFDKVKAAPMPFFIKPVAKGIADQVTKAFIGPNIQRNMDFIESHLARNPHFAGPDFSAADIQMSFPLEAAGSRHEGHYPNIKAWLERMHARPAYKKALEAGGPYDYA